MNTLCGVMTNLTIGVPLQRLVALAKQFSPVMSCSVENFIESMSDTKWDDSTSEGVGGELSCVHHVFCPLSMCVNTSVSILEIPRVSTPVVVPVSLNGESLCGQLSHLSSTETTQLAQRALLGNRHKLC